MIAVAAALGACVPAAAATPRLDVDAPSLLWFAARNATEFDRVCDCSQQGPTVFAAIAQDRDKGDEVSMHAGLHARCLRRAALTHCLAPVSRLPVRVGHAACGGSAGGGLPVAGSGADAA